MSQPEAKSSSQQPSRPRRLGAKKPTSAWYVTYSDMITLLLCFFVLLYASSNLDVKKFKVYMDALQSAFGVMVDDVGILDSANDFSTEQSDSDMDMMQAIYRLVRSDWEQLNTIHSSLLGFLKAEQLEDKVAVFREERGLVLSFKDRVMFDSGKAELTNSAKQILSRTSEFLKEWPNHVRVEGHTDNVPISNDRFPSNWELSSTRATNVLRFLLEETGFDPMRISAVGYGEHHPLKPNDSPENRSQNRRVDIVILRRSLWDMDDVDIEQMLKEAPDLG